MLRLGETHGGRVRGDPGSSPALGKQWSHDYSIDVPATVTPMAPMLPPAGPISNHTYQETLDCQWRKWTKGGCSFLQVLLSKLIILIKLSWKKPCHGKSHTNFKVVCLPNQRTPGLGIKTDVHHLHSSDTGSERNPDCSEDATGTLSRKKICSTQVQKKAFFMAAVEQFKQNTNDCEDC